MLGIADCDLLIGIFWKRFGTPVHDAQSGTEHEFLTAYHAWQQHRKPQIMVYFNQRPATPKTVAEAEQWRQVLAFKERFPKEGLWWPYRGKADFERKVRHHLTRFIQQEVPRETVPGNTPSPSSGTSARLQGSGGMAQGADATAAGKRGVAVGHGVQDSIIVTGDHATVTVHPPTLPGPSAEARQRYLTHLRRVCQALPLASLGSDPSAEQQELTLDDVYIELHTTTQVPVTQRRRQRQTLPERDTETRPLTALEAFTQCPRLALLGDPGSGKSTFGRKLLAWIAAAHLGKTALPPGCAADLLPLLLTLRDLAPTLATLDLEKLSEERRRRALAETMRDALLGELERYEASDFRDGARAALVDGRCLLVLDGLDEVPPALRPHVREAVAAVARAYAVQRLLVTCRVRSYVGEAVLPGFQAHTLAPFDAEQIKNFAHAWYQAQKTLGSVDARQAEARATDLAQAAQAEELRQLAQNPMMLTTMAIIHQRDIGLPRERVRLYQRAVDVLLRRWQQGKTGKADMAPQTELVAVLNDDRRLFPMIQALAYQAHQSRQDGKAVTDLPRGTALVLLSRPEYLGSAGLAEAFLEYVEHRAGLLSGRGSALSQPETYSFPHRIFQEYLAACHLLRQRDIVRTLFQHAQEGEFWGLVVQLAAEELLYNLQRDNELLDLMYALCPASEHRSSADQRAVLWSGQMAALLGPERIARDTDRRDGGQEYLARLRPRLLTVMRGDLPAPERAEAGNALARLGDPRFREDAWFLPDEPLLGFVEIPAGSFVMGSNDARGFAVFKASPRHDVVLPTFYIARYPVTVAQFRAFVEASGHKLADERSLRGLANHPVIGINWFDALAYCNWLTAQLRQWPGTPEPLATLLRQQGWRVLPPSEAEWEKAARGTDGRRYPWGHDADPNRANYDDTNINTTSAVGCFPGGVSPYGVEEMSGNVWEWTRSAPEDYPYPADDTARAQRETLHVRDDDGRVLRGGAFWDDHRHVRCASRDRNYARHLDDYSVMRVVLAACPYL